MSDKIAFCNVSFGERYVNTQHRLKQSILDIYHDAELFFWTDELPPGSRPFQESLYGFKVHAIKYARDKGFTKVVWIDTCAVLIGKLEPLFESNFIAIKDENALYKFQGPGPYENTTLMNRDWKLVGGSLYLFDFENNKYKVVFDNWEAMESAGRFGTQEFIMNQKNDGIERMGWRMDECCMAFCIYGNGLKPDGRGIYDSVIEKKHFLEPGQSGLNEYLK